MSRNGNESPRTTVGRCEAGMGRPMIADGTDGERVASWDGGRSWHVLRCGYCRRTDCATECGLAWEVRYGVGRGAVDPSTWGAETWAEWGRLVGRGLVEPSNVEV